MNHTNTSIRDLFTHMFRLYAVLIACLMLLGAEGVLALGAAGNAVVGEVSFVLGKAYVQEPGAKRELIKVGTLISVSDNIETTTNGHVHIRFVDNALVSLRPSSKLEIVRYDYIAEVPEASVVKLNFIEGETRAISGKAAEEARENFRMNTPIAAIGVRGTDFVVSANRDSVRARVNQGAIIVAPFSLQCSVDTFGPCNQNALELAGGASQIIQISADDLDPVLLPLSPSGVPVTLLAARSEEPAPRSDEREEKENELFTGTVSLRAVNQKLGQAKSLLPVVPPVIESPALVSADFTPDVAVSAQALVSSQLVWGRYNGMTVQNERITMPYDDAENLGRQAAVANNTYMLFRSTIDKSKEVQPGLGVVGFSLTQAQAFFRNASGSTLMDVYGGQLSIDFGHNRFSTSLDLGHADTGKISFSESGIISGVGYGGGYFHNVRSPEKNLGGAISLDGLEAGYFFDQTLSNGVIEGLTLWGRQP